MAGVIALIVLFASSRGLRIHLHGFAGRIMAWHNISQLWKHYGRSQLEIHLQDQKVQLTMAT
jgi:hypothetical protein